MLEQPSNGMVPVTHGVRQVVQISVARVDARKVCIPVFMKKINAAVPAKTSADRTVCWCTAADRRRSARPGYPARSSV